MEIEKQIESLLNNTNQFSKNTGVNLQVKIIIHQQCDYQTCYFCFCICLYGNVSFYCITEYAIGQGETNPVFWLTNRAGQDRPFLNKAHHRTRFHLLFDFAFTAIIFVC